MTGIYKWVNKVTNKVYVGSAAVSLLNRRKEHIKALGDSKHYNRYLQNAWNKHGKDNFKFVIIELCIPSKCLERETYWINQLLATDQKYGYNICKEGHNCLGVKRSEETKKRMSECRIGKISKENIDILIERNKSMNWSKEMRENHAKMLEERWKDKKFRDNQVSKRVGKKHSEEHKKKIGDKHRGKVTSKETKLKMSIAKKGYSGEDLKKEFESQELSQIIANRLRMRKAMVK